MISINLLPKDLRRSSGPDLYRSLAVAVPIVAIIVMAGVQLYASAELGRVQQDADSANSELTLLQPRVQERNNLQTQLLGLQAVAGVSDQLIAKRSLWSSDLLTFVDALPRGSGAPVVALQTLTMADAGAVTPGAPTPSGPHLYDGKAVTRTFALTGQTPSTAALVQFLKTFEDTSDFGVQFQSATQDAQSGNYNFSATVGMVGTSLVPAAQSVGGQATGATSTGATSDSGGQSAR